MNAFTFMVTLNKFFALVIQREKTAYLYEIFPCIESSHFCWSFEWSFEFEEDLFFEKTFKFFFAIELSF